MHHKTHRASIKDDNKERAGAESGSVTETNLAAKEEK
jgi:hypothetical protein